VSKLKKWLPILLFFSIGNTFAATSDDFVFQGKPINPACVAMFNSSMSDTPYISSIILNNCQNSNAAYKTILKNKDNSYYFYNNNKDEREGSYSYKVMGKTNNGIYVLRTLGSGGGTMIADNLLLIRLVNRSLYVDEAHSGLKDNVIIEMKLIGYISGGDRCVGGYDEIKVIGNQIKAKQFTGKDAADCTSSKNVTIDLNI